MSWSPNSPWLRFTTWLNQEGQDNHLKAAGAALIALFIIVGFLTGTWSPLP